MLEYFNTKLNSLRRNRKNGDRRDNHRLALLSTSVLSLINNLSKRKEVFSKILLNCSKVSPGGISEITAFHVNDDSVLIFPQLIADFRTNRQHPQFIDQLNLESACSLFDKNMAEDRSTFQSKVNIDVRL